ncbi:MAG: PorV/PorQ family protein [Candidatus Latescibacterota bacterium]|nr:PorV/PorQ family protein [Candidatus Latescibacterota bacterium]
MRKSIPLILAALLVVPVAAEATNDNVGTAGFSFLKVPVGARASALGGTFTAVSGDLEATATNPAGLVGVKERTAALSLTSYLVDTEAGFLSFAVPGDRRLWAISVNYFSFGEMVRTDEDGQNLGTFNAFDFAAYITAAQKVWSNRLTLGVNFKAIYSSIDDFTSDAYAVDLGVLSPGPIDGMTLGASLSNLGSVRNGYTHGFEDSLPVVFKAGFSHRPAHTPVPLLLLVDINVPNDNDPFFSFGAEIQLAGDLYLRPGYSLQQTGAAGDDPLGLSAGGGVVVKKMYHVDYAFTSFPDLGDVHRLSVTGSF